VILTSKGFPVVGVLDVPPREVELVLEVLVLDVLVVEVAAGAGLEVPVEALVDVFAEEVPEALLGVGVARVVSEPGVDVEAVLGVGVGVGVGAGGGSGVATWVGGGAGSSGTLRTTAGLGTSGPPDTLSLARKNLKAKKAPTPAHPRSRRTITTPSAIHGVLERGLPAGRDSALELGAVVGSATGPATTKGVPCGAKGLPPWGAKGEGGGCWEGEGGLGGACGGGACGGGAGRAGGAA
jgi:hypothetical protein